MVFTSQQGFKKSSGNSSSGGDDSKKRKSMMNRGASSSKFDKKSGSGYRGHSGRGGSRKIDDYSGFDMDERRRPGGGGRGGGGKENVVDKRFYDGEKDILCFGLWYYVYNVIRIYSPVVILLLFCYTILV